MAVIPDFTAVRAEFGLPDGFPPAVLAEAAAAAAVRPVAGPDRLDATDVELVTIDPPGSKDLDQALGVVRSGAGFRVYYAIADLGAVVVPGAALDTEVRRRGQTVYLPDGAVPLHPPVLSEDAASLLPDGPRAAVLWRIDLDAEGEPVSVDVRRAVVRSRARLDYASVQAAVDAGEIHPAIAALPEVGPLRRALAVRRGAIELELPEQEVVRAADTGGTTDGGWTVQVRRRTPRRGLERRDLAAHGHLRGADHARRGDRRAAHPARRGARLRDGVARGGTRPGHRLAHGRDGRRAAVRAAPRHAHGPGPAPGRDVVAPGRRLHRLRHRRRRPAARRCGTRGDRRAVRARHRAVAEAGRPVRHGAVPGPHGRDGGARLAARRAARPARDDGRIRRRGQCGHPGVRRPDRGRSPGGPRRVGLRRRGAPRGDRQRVRRGLRARPARDRPLRRRAAAGGDGPGAAGGGRPGHGAHRLHR